MSVEKEREARGAGDTRRAQPVQKVENVVGARVVLVSCVREQRKERRRERESTLPGYLASEPVGLLDPNSAKTEKALQWQKSCTEAMYQCGQ